jgi:HKD family nuclease
MTAQVSVHTGDALLHAIRELVSDADEALLCVAFANQAGVNLVAPALQHAGQRVRLLSTTVFGGTTAAALGRAASLGSDVRVLNLPRGTYHPKLFLARHGLSCRALVGSANLTSGLLRNVEVGALLSGGAEVQALRELRELAEGWWEHPAAVPWTPELPAPAGDTFVEDLWSELQAVLAPRITVRTLSDPRPNRIVEITPGGVWIETERSRQLGRGAEEVPAWMFNIAWDYLVAHGRLTNRHLLDSDGLNVKRSSAVCAVLALLPEVEVVSRRPIELRLRPEVSPLAAEEPTGYEP